MAQLDIQTNSRGSMTSGDRANSARVAMIQDGSRLHYAVPVALQRAGILHRVFTTDLYVKPGSVMERAIRLLSRLKPRLGQRMLSRQNVELDSRFVHQNIGLALRDHLARPKRGRPVPTEHWVQSHARLGRWIERRGLKHANVLMGFVTSIDPGLCRRCRERGMIVVVDQMIAPTAIELQEAAIQTERWPDWQPHYSLDELAKFEPFEAATWANADHITCASDYVARGLAQCGVDANRVSVIPYPLDIASMAAPERAARSNRDRPFTVGFIGMVNLRKGAPYFFEVARRFDPRFVRFVMVGKVGLQPEIAAMHKGHVELVGPVARHDVPRWLGEFDVFFFPSTCEGSAGAIIEAMASGLPVVVSANSGSYARDGIEGFVRTYDDIDGFAECISRLRDDARLRETMGQAAQLRASSFDINHYSRTISSLLARLLQSHPKED